jgi:tRNA pseudouridine55 synthase
MRGSALGGVMLVSKPAGVTSHDVVETIRRSPIAAGRKVGHAGTLDPFATGLLLILVGRATRVQRFFVVLPKVYRTVARMGVTSDTGDPTGTLTETGVRVDEGVLRAMLPRLVGDIEQRVPLTSAVKVGGERLYEKARRGEEFETPVRPVRIERLDLIHFDEEEQRATLEVECSSGTYVRQLVTDLGTLCGAGAHCDALERLSIGQFRVEDADAERLMPLSEALDFMPERALSADEAERARHGGAVPGATDNGVPATSVRLTANGQLLAVAEPRDGLLKPVTVLS